MLVTNKYSLVATSSKLMDSELLLNKLDDRSSLDQPKDTDEVLTETAANLFNYLTEQTTDARDKSAEVESVRAKLAYLLNFKLTFLNGELNFVMNSIEANEKLGQQVIKGPLV